MPTSNLLPSNLWEAEQFLREVPHWDRLSASLCRIIPDLVLLFGQARLGDREALRLFWRMGLADACDLEILRFIRQNPPKEAKEIA